ncbi:MAG TPA: TetR family transcriptional regulator [Actinomycetota bacterium]|nr:TetR family transcriptional regulator [Actinomycetota bacterium]
MSAEPLRAVDGRVPGRRGRATRDKLLKATTELLTKRSYRDLTVVEIAKRARTSTATFYQYFADVEAALAELAHELAEEGPRLVDIINAAKWRTAAYEPALALVDAFIDLWERHRAILRVVDLATAEGDLRFQNIRTHLLSQVTDALRDAIVKASDGKAEPRAQAAALVSLLAHVAEHRYGFEFWGIRLDDMRRSTARLVAWGVTEREPS